MAISRVEIRDLRNLESVMLEPGEGINILSGANGAGKTSVLEGIYMLGRGRSFRTSQARPIIREGCDCVEVVGVASGQSRVVGGIRRRGKSSLIRINGESVSRMSELARVFPVQLVTPRSHELLERGPELRRRFLDWGLFHVEQSYGETIARYNRVLRQRNEALKRKGGEAAHWEEQLSTLGEQIHLSRGRYLKSLVDSLTPLERQLKLPGNVELSMVRGWGGTDGLQNALVRRRDQDNRAGFTSAGPHRDDIRIQSEGASAVDRLSRGQQKMLVLGLILAQMLRVAEEIGHAPVLLVDDLAAELDTNARARVIEFLVERSIQVFISTLEPGLLGGLPRSAAMFHVEQGCLQRQTKATTFSI